MVKGIDVGSLNTGLARVASTRTYPVVKRPYMERKTKGRLFRIGVLHAKEFSEEMLLRNRRGYINAQVNTVAHAPSMYHWLFHRCGIPFAETRELSRHGRLMADGVLVTKESDLESQLEWSTFQNLDIQVLCTAGHTAPRGEAHSAAAAKEGGRWVSALKRALHRSYFFTLLHPGVSVSSEEANPRSFIHRTIPHMGPSAATVSALGLNVLRPIGFVDGMTGLGIATNDVAIIRYWNNEFLGNYGEYDVRFVAGAPGEMVDRAEAELRAAIAGVRAQIPSVIQVPCHVARQKLSRHDTNDMAVLHPGKVLQTTERLLVSTPLMPYRVFTRLRRAGAFFTLTRSGPFVLPRSLLDPQQPKVQALTPQELAVLFMFERRLKTNRVLLSLNEFSADAYDGDQNANGDA